MSCGDLFTLLALVILGVKATTSQHSTSTATSHRIPSLPGYSGVHDFDQYAGRLSLPSTNHSHKLFYWLVEASDRAPTDAPLVLWLNGGPGCSSLTGLFTELGPFVVQPDLTLRRNPYAWTRHANVLFVESPLGVGFSGLRPPSPADFNDGYTASRLTEFLAEFVQAYPAYADRDFFVAGESYAGMYIPHVVTALLDVNTTKFVRLKGFAIGNPITDHAIDNNAFLEYYYTHAMISLEAYEDVRRQCNTTALVAQFSGIWANYRDSAHPCAVAVKEAMDQADTTHLNRYDIYADVCLEPPSLQKLSRPTTHRGPTGGPCADKYTQAYLRQRSVQEAIHVVEGVEGALAWRSCEDDITDVLYQRSMSVLPLYLKLLASNLTVLIYSGDTDSMVNFMGTQRWISTEGLRLKVNKNWQAWFGPDRQLAGYAQEYESGLTYKTIKGAGHMVPATRPLHGLYLFECFVLGQEACDNLTYPTDNLEYLAGENIPYAKNEDSLDVTNGIVLWWHLLLWYAVVVAITGLCVARIEQLARQAASRPVYVALKGGQAKAQYDTAT